MEISRIGVAGAGLMGGGIAQSFAEHGREVVLWDVDAAALAKGRAAIEKRLAKSAEKGGITKDQAAAIAGRIQGVTDLAGFRGCGLVIEAVVEDPEVKQRLFAGLEAAVAPDIVLATNTSSLSVGSLAAGLQRPERFLGVHFFNPPTKLELVELVAGPATAPAVCESVASLLRACGKTPVQVKDSPGFIVNRLLLLMINEAVRMVDEGVASPADIDTAMRLGALHPAGPLAVADLIGLDTCNKILAVLETQLGRQDFAPAAGIRGQVDAGRLGRKTGAGFFTY